MRSDVDLNGRSYNGVLYVFFDSCEIAGDSSLTQSKYLFLPETFNVALNHMIVNVIVHWETLVMLALLSGLQLQDDVYPEVTFSFVLIANSFSHVALCFRSSSHVPCLLSKLVLQLISVY